MRESENVSLSGVAKRHLPSPADPREHAHDARVHHRNKRCLIDAEEPFAGRNTHGVAAAAEELGPLPPPVVLDLAVHLPERLLYPLVQNAAKEAWAWADLVSSTRRPLSPQPAICSGNRDTRVPHSAI